MTPPIPDLERAWRLVDTMLFDSLSTAVDRPPRDDFDKGFRRGLDTGLCAAMEIMERIRDEAAGTDS